MEHNNRNHIGNEEKFTTVTVDIVAAPTTMMMNTTATNDNDAPKKPHEQLLQELPTATNNNTTATMDVVVQYTSPPSGIGSIPTDMECLVSMDDITEENYVEYQIHPTYEWKSALLSQPIIEHLLQTQFNTYMERIQASDCQAELKRLIEQGPPIYISDPYGLPLPDTTIDDKTTTTSLVPNSGASLPVPQKENNNNNLNYYVMNLWYASDQQIHSSILQNAVVGDAHAQLWNELQSYLIPTTTNSSSTTTDTSYTSNNTKNSANDNDVSNN
jgi:hypothetical protein